MVKKNDNRKSTLKKKEIGKRLKELRLEKGLSQTQLANELQKFDCEIVLEGDNGKQTVSQIENGSRNLNLELAYAYCEIFDTTLDFIFCRTHDRKPSYSSIKSSLGLDDKTLHGLEAIAKYKKMADVDSKTYKYGYDVTKRLEACNYLIQNACKDFEQKDSKKVNFTKSLLDNIYTYIFSSFGIDKDSEFKYSETTVCKNEFCVEVQSRKIKQLVMLDIQEDLINLRNNIEGEKSWM